MWTILITLDLYSHEDPAQISRRCSAGPLVCGRAWRWRRWGGWSSPTLAPSAVGCPQCSAAAAQASAPHTQINQFETSWLNNSKFITLWSEFLKFGFVIKWATQDVVATTTVEVLSSLMLTNYVYFVTTVYKLDLSV